MNCNYKPLGTLKDHRLCQLYETLIEILQS